MKAGSVRIAHAYGNRRDRLQEALSANVDMIEADVWYHRGHVHVRHEHRLGRLPFLVDKRSPSMPVFGPWALRLPRRYFVRPDLRPLPLNELLQTVDARKGLLIDVKGSRPSEVEGFAKEIVRHIEQQNTWSWTAVCGYWPVLDAIRATTPRLEVRYTVSSPELLAAYLDRFASGQASPGVCAYHRLLGKTMVDELTGKGIDTYAWTVDDPALAKALVESGVSGITSNDLTLLAGLRPDAKPAHA